MNWPGSAACASRAHCAACRLSPAFRASIAVKYPGWDESCPHGVTLENLPLPVARTVSHRMNADGTRCGTCAPVIGEGSAVVVTRT